MTDTTPAYESVPEDGDTGTVTFTPTGGSALTLRIQYVDGWGGCVEPCLTVEGVNDLLGAWRAVDPAHRNYGWPITERDDDDAMIAFNADATGELILDSWPVANDRDLFSLSQLPALLPGAHYTLSETHRS
jgi:hypothetical protein